MVATIKVLAGAVKRIVNYFEHEDSEATGRYYSVERPGQWHGLGAGRLGLNGEVTGLDFQLLLSGHGPDGKPLVRLPKPRPPVNQEITERTKQQEQPNLPASGAQGKGQDVGNRKKQAKAIRVPGYDVCFSAPKSISILWVVSAEKTRLDIEACLMTAVRKTLDNLESFVPLGRRGRGGSKQQFAELVASLFLHTVSRAGDPALHVHSVLSNTCHGEDDRWSSVDSRLLHQWTPALGRVFRCHLASELTQKLGFELTRPTNALGQSESWFEVAGVPNELIQEFSTRRAEIEQKTGQENLADSRARQRANLETRRSKDELPDTAELVKKWREQANQHGFNRWSVEHLMHRAERKLVSQAELEQVFLSSVQRASEGRAHFTEAQVIQGVCEALQHRSVNPTELFPQIREKLEHSNQLVRLVDAVGKQRFATQEYWKVEQRLLEHVDELSNRLGAQVSARRVDKLLSPSDRTHGSKLSDEQKTAVRHLLTQQKSIRCLEGVAGSGKTLVLDAVRRGFESQGYQVIGGALAGKATAGLQESANIQSRTVASYLYHLDKSRTDELRDSVKHHARMLLRELCGKKSYKREKVKIPKKSVLIIDEASMLDTRTMTRLVHHASRAKATVILVGDSNQLPAIDAGGPAQHIAAHVGSVDLKTNRRQRQQEDREAVQAVRDGRITEALENYSKRDLVKLAKNHNEAIEQAVQSWAAEGGSKQPEKHVILTQTRADAEKVNHACQKERLATQHSLPGFSVSLGKNRFYAGDRVLFHRPMRTYGVENGFTGTVLGVDPILGRMTVKLDQTPAKQSRATCAKPIVTIPVRKQDPSAITLGYAATTHKLQGATVEQAYILLSGRMLSKEMVYTQLTRAKGKTQLFVNKESAGKELVGLIAAMERSVQKNLAHDVNPNPTVPIKSIEADRKSKTLLERIIRRAEQAKIENPQQPTLKIER